MIVAGLLLHWWYGAVMRPHARSQNAPVAVFFQRNNGVWHVHLNDGLSSLTRDVVRLDALRHRSQTQAQIDNRSILSCFPLLIGYHAIAIASF